MALFSSPQRPAVLTKPADHPPRLAEDFPPIGQVPARPLTPASPCLPIRLELVQSGISGGILQRDLGQSPGIPVPLQPPTLAALPLLAIVRGSPGVQWVIQ